jgi:TonB-linked SusC/RagA family outer membrane protein
LSDEPENLRYDADLSYNDVEGALKGSQRKVLDGSMSLLYKYKNISFQNRLEVTNTKSSNSPYGSFSDYCALNPYYTPYDNNGNLNKILEDYFYQSLQSTNKVYNPLFNAYLPSKNTSSYTDITNNCAIEWYIIPELFLRGQFSFTKEFTRSDIYIPADNTMFDSYTGDDYSRKGRYTYNPGESMQYNGRLTLNYTKDFGKHQLFGGFGLTIDQSKSESYTIIGEGLSIDKMDFIGMSKQYMEGTTPTGTESISRDFGLLCNLQYTYNQQYFIDLNGKYDGSSQFGSNNHFAPFWSTGIGWNIHNEKFMKKYKWIDIARLRTSYGITGSQNFASYLGMRTYQIYSGQSTQNWYGVYLLAYGNPDLKWQTTSQLNLGFDLELVKHRLVVNFDWYNKLTHDLLADVNLPLSSGFSSYKDNIGTVRNKGYEVSFSAQIIRDLRNNFYWTVGLKAARNINKIEKISNSLQKLNDELTSEDSYNPSFLYKEGQSLNTIYAVRSKGIDPSTGKEIYITSDGTETFIWNAKDEVPCGVAEPKIQGNINTNVRWKGFSLNVICGFRLGGYAYNSTLANKVENINPYDNADRRALYDRWKKPGDLVKFKSVTDFTPTYATSRFVFKDNTFYGSSLNLGYEFPQEWIKKHLSVSYLAINGYMEDLFWLSTIKRERGTDYPFSRKFSFSLTVRF